MPRQINVKADSHARPADRHRRRRRAWHPGGRSARTCSGRSSGSMRRATRMRAAPGSACRSPATSPAAMAATSPWMHSPTGRLAGDRPGTGVSTLHVLAANSSSCLRGCLTAALVALPPRRTPTKPSNGCLKSSAAGRTALRRGMDTLASRYAARQRPGRNLPTVADGDVAIRAHGRTAGMGSVQRPRPARSSCDAGLRRRRPARPAITPAAPRSIADRARQHFRATSTLHRQLSGAPRRSPQRIVRTACRRPAPCARSRRARLRLPRPESRASALPT